MSRRELKSAERRIPTLNESRSFGRGKSVPFDTLRFALSQPRSLNVANQPEIDAMLAKNDGEFELLRKQTRDANPSLYKKLEEARQQL